MLADAREAMTALDAALADSGWQAGWGAQIESVQSRQLKETQRVYQAVWQEKSFVPEIDDHLDRESVYREFRQITDSTLTQSSVLGVLNETLPAEAVIVAAAELAIHRFTIGMIVVLRHKGFLLPHRLVDALGLF